MKRIFQNTLLILGSLVFCFLLIEIPLTLMGYGDLIIYEADPKLFWKPKPNQKCYTKIGHKRVLVNDNGTRGRNFETSKPKNVYRVLSLGDSKTFGWGLEEPETYSSLIEGALQNSIGDSLDVEVINAGVNAWGYSQMYTYLKDIGLTYNPDLVIVGDANLWTQFSENSKPKFVAQMMKKVWLKNLVRRSAMYHYFIEVKLQKYYYKFRKKFIAVQPENDTLFKEQQSHDPNHFFKDNIEKICTFLADNNIPGLLLYIPNEREIKGNMEPRIQPIKQKIASAYQMPFVDVTAIFKEDLRNLYLHADPVHPNADGNKIIAREILKSLGYIKTTNALSLN